MNIIEKIDATLAATRPPCVRCGNPLGGRAPSQDFCSKRCGVWWYGSDLDRIEHGLQPVQGSTALAVDDVARIFGVPAWLLDPYADMGPQPSPRLPHSFARAYLYGPTDPAAIRRIMSITGI